MLFVGGGRMVGVLLVLNCSIFCGMEFERFYVFVELDVFIFVIGMCLFFLLGLGCVFYVGLLESYLIFNYFNVLVLNDGLYDLFIN